MMNSDRLLPLLFCLLLTAGCATTPAITAAPTSEPCRPSGIQETTFGFPEIRGDMHSDGELWALLFFGKAFAGQELKIVWRIRGGEGTPTVRAALDDGTTSGPIWGPEFHDSSTWERPGDEWGTGFNLPRPGCWTFTAALGDTTGEIRLEVLPAR
jgi:hypothetical protein